LCRRLRSASCGISTRYRTRLVQQRAAEVQRVDKLLEEGGIKLGSVASNTLGVSGRAMLQALIAGESDPDRLAELAKGRLRAKRDELRLALQGRFGQHHRVMLRVQLDHIDHLDAAICALDDRVDEVMAPFAVLVDLLDSITGIDKRAAEVIIAEIGVSMGVFATAAHLASWAKICPGNNESAGNAAVGAPGRATRGCARSWSSALGRPRAVRTRICQPSFGGSRDAKARGALRWRSLIPCW
jgi:transposase